MTASERQVVSVRWPIPVTPRTEPLTCVTLVLIVRMSSGDFGVDEFRIDPLSEQTDRQRDEPILSGRMCAESPPWPRAHNSRHLPST